MLQNEQICYTHTTKNDLKCFQAASEFVMYCALEKSIGEETGQVYRYRKHFHKANKRLDNELARNLWEKSTVMVRLNERLLRVK